MPGNLTGTGAARKMVGMDELQITNNLAANRFQVTLGEHLALLNYTIKPGIFQIDYVFVPPLFRGQGIASQLMETALAYARSAGLHVVPICSYARVYLERSAGPTVAA